MTRTPDAAPSTAGRRWTGLSRFGSGRRTAWRLGVAAAVGALLVWGLRAWVVEPVRAASGSMAPTLAVGERALVDKVSLRLRPPRHGELVVFPAPGDGAPTVKRVVGLPGDSVAILDAQLHRNGAPVPEPYVDLASVDGMYFGPVSVPPGTVLVMGDNRADSIDSRHFGPIARADLVGTAHPL